MCSRICSSAVTVVLIALVTGSALGQETQRLAFIYKLSGEVSIARAPNEPFEKADFGTPLFEGDRLQTGATASVTIIYSNESLVTLEAGRTITISAEPAEPRSSADTASREGRELVSNLTELMFQRTGVGDITDVGGFRTSGSDTWIEVLSPRNTRIRSQAPRFSWYTDSSFERFEVKLYDDTGLVWSGVTTEKSLKYPEDAPTLSPNTEYFWKVEGEEFLETTASPSESFQLLSESARSEVTETESQIRSLFGDGDGDNSYRMLLGAYYAKAGLRSDAIASFIRISEEHPDAAMPLEILGVLYHEVGLNKDAVDALRRAVLREQRK